MAGDTSEESEFRQRYSERIQTFNESELDDERKKVKHQGMKTPGRRGEQIKHEEIDRELVRRHSSKARS
jgi:hypothetical protein